MHKFAILAVKSLDSMPAVKEQSPESSPPRYLYFTADDTVQACRDGLGAH
jgi:hypothetical protein